MPTTGTRRDAPVTRLVVIDDHAIVRRGLRGILERETKVEIVGEAATAPEALEVVGRLRPDIVLLDLKLGADEEAGLALCRDLTEQFPEVGVLVLTTFLTQRLVTEAIRNGARGYVLKDVDAVELVKSVEAVRRGEGAFGGQAAAAMIRSLSGDSEDDEWESLTEREREVLDLVGQGLSNQEIGSSLFISLATVKFHLHNVMGKLGVHRRAELAFRAGRLDRG